MKICFLASGGGGNFKFLHLARELEILNDIKLSLIADRECDALTYAKKNNLNAKLITYQKHNNEQLLNALVKIKPDIIITNWHKIIDEKVVSAYVGKLINLHYSLLPAFPGLIGIAPIKEAYRQNCKYVGTTCHYVDTGVDTGAIISQAIVKNNIELDDMISRVFRKGCLILLNSILIVSNKNIINTSKNDKHDFSPSLNFNDNMFTENFWKDLSQL